MAMNQINGYMNTNTKFGDSSMQPQCLDETFYQQWKNESSFVKLLSLVNRRAAGNGQEFAVGSATVNTDNAEFFWFNIDNGTPMTTVVTPPSPPTTGLEIIVAEGTAGMFKPQDTIYNSTHPEQMIVSEVIPAENKIKVIRNLGEDQRWPTAPATIAAGDSLVYTGSAWAEGSGPAEPIAFGAYKEHNYCQIFKESVGITGTMEVTKTYGGIGQIPYQKEQALKKYYLGKSKAYYIGQRCLNPNTGAGVTDFNQPHAYTYTLDGSKVRRMTGGLEYFIQSNRVESTYDNFNYGTFIDFMSLVHQYDDDERYFICSPSMITLVTKGISGNLPNARAFSGIELTDSPNAATYGLNIKTLKTPSGDINFMEDKALAHIFPATQAVGYALNLKEVTERVLRPDQWQDDIIRDGSDRKLDQILGETGLQVVNEKHQARLSITGITGG